MDLQEIVIKARDDVKEDLEREKSREDGGDTMVKFRLSGILETLNLCLSRAGLGNA